MSILETQTYTYWAAQQARRLPKATDEVRERAAETIAQVAKHSVGRALRNLSAIESSRSNHPTGGNAA